MSTRTVSIFESYLREFTESDWSGALQSLLPAIHEVDRNAVQVWFRFYPLSLQRFLSDASNTDEARRALAMQGHFGLEDAVDTSHSYLYGHRFWKAAKAAIVTKSSTFVDVSGSLETEIEKIADKIAMDLKVDKSVTLAISAVGLMTLTQVGLDRFTRTAGEEAKRMGLLAKSPDSIVAARKKDDSQGLLGFLKTVDQKFSVIYDEGSNSGRFAIMNDQEIASASANDRSQDWQSKDARCWEGPVPVECTSASCGTCWVGVIAGQEKLSSVARREERAVKVFGYNQTDEEKPLIRLACQTKAYGNVTIVIPPWNAVFGKKVYGNVEELELEPATTSARALREVVREAAAGGSDE